MKEITATNIQLNAFSHLELTEGINGNLDVVLSRREVLHLENRFVIHFVIPKEQRCNLAHFIVHGNDSDK